MLHFGFSYIGLIYLLLLFIPNIIWSKKQPKDYEKYAANENKILLVMERTGEIREENHELIQKGNQND